MEDLENYQELVDGVLQNRARPKSFKIWRFLILMCIFFFFAFSASVILCISNGACSKYVPTVYVLLQSKISSPYMLLAMTCGLLTFSSTSFAMFITVDNIFVMFAGAIVYASVAVILFVYPFVGWDATWAIAIFIVAFLIWMGVILFTTRNTSKTSIRAFGITCSILYVISSVAYIILKAVNIENKSIEYGLLGMEVLGIASVVGFMAFAILFSWNVTVVFNP